MLKSWVFLISGGNLGVAKITAEYIILFPDGKTKFFKNDFDLTSELRELGAILIYGKT